MAYVLFILIAFMMLGFEWVAHRYQERRHHHSDPRA